MTRRPAKPAARRTSPADRAAEMEAQVRLAEARLRRRELKLASRVMTQREKAVAAMLSTYKAAGHNRATRDWRARSSSANQAVVPDAPTLTARARQMVRDDAYAASYRRAVVRNVVGRGVTPAAAARGPDAPDGSAGPLLDGLNRQLDALWYDWTRRPAWLDLEGRRSFWRMQRWAISEYAQVGECFVIRHVRPDLAGPRRPGLILQCLEAEQLDTSRLEHQGNQVVGGVEVDAHGRALAYWFWDTHPDDRWRRPSQWQSVRVPASVVCHVMDPERVQQVRGASPMASALLRMRDLGEYDYAQLLAAKAEACIGLLIKAPQRPGDAVGLALPPGQSTTDAAGNDELAAQPLMVAHLKEGEDVTGFTPQRPGGMYEPFTRTQLRAAAAGVGISYEQIARDFSQGTYSSQRQGMLEDRREFRAMQQMLVEQLCMPIWDDFVLTALVGGLVAAPLADRAADTLDRLAYARWRGDGWPWIDPAKEATGIREKLALGLTTLENEAAEQGEDWRELADQAALERQYIQALTPTPATPATPADPAIPTPESQLPASPTPPHPDPPAGLEDAL